MRSVGHEDGKLEAYRNKHLKRCNSALTVDRLQEIQLKVMQMD